MFDINAKDALSLLQQLRTWLDTNEQAQLDNPRDYEHTAQWRTSNEEIEKRLLGLRLIAGRVAPQLTERVRSSYKGFTWQWGDVRAIVNQLAGALQQQDELQAALTPVGPMLSASQLYPRLWKASAALWDDRHYQQAVEAACASVERQLKQKLGVHRTGVDLVAHAFSKEEPKDGDPRLRFTRWPRESPSWTNAHEGALAYARGCAMAIRNLVAHERMDIDEQRGLEYLAALSVLARWIDEAEVVKV